MKLPNRSTDMDMINDIEYGRGTAAPVAKIENSYHDFINERGQQVTMHGFEPLFLPDCMFDFQRDLVSWAVQKGRAAIFADCGLGKTLMQLVWAENIYRHTGKPVLLLTPLAVGQQTLAEGSKFNIECARSRDGSIPGSIVVSNYQQLHKFDAAKVGGLVCDESSILKNFDGKTKEIVTRFAKQVPYRLLCTATAAPNDYHELGTSSEALGELGFRDMITKFFKQETSNGNGWGRTKYRFREHGVDHFWRWVCSWARAVRRPSDLGYSNEGFDLPELIVNETEIKASRQLDGYLFALPANGLREERQERRQTIAERCDWVTEKVNNEEPAVVWGHLNDECDLLVKKIDGAEQIKGGDSDEAKESRFEAFARGDLRVLVTKPKIGAWGLNWQHCNYMTMFPSHSYEQYYQSVRRCWRFGQTRPVTVDIVSTEGEHKIAANLREKASRADEMFASLCREMNNEERIVNHYSPIRTELPQWL